MPRQAPAHGFDQSLYLHLPPLGCLVFAPESRGRAREKTSSQG